MGRLRLNQEGDPCSICGVRPVVYKGELNKDGSRKYRKVCRTCHQKKHTPHTRRNSRQRKYAKIRLALVEDLVCECCGFTAQHPCQLDVDHINGNHDDNSPENLQVLCANCHRLKTFLNRDWENRSPFYLEIT